MSTGTSRGRRPRRTRRGVVLAVAATVATALLLDRGLTVWSHRALPFLEDREFADRYEGYRPRAAQARADGKRMVAVVGSSRVEWGVRARTVEACVAAGRADPPVVHHFGFPGATPLVEWAIVRRMLHHSPPAALVLELNPVFAYDENGVTFANDQAAAKLSPDERVALDRFGWRNLTTAEYVEECRPRWYTLRDKLIARVRPRFSYAPPQPPAPSPAAAGWTEHNAWGDPTFVVPSDKFSPRMFEAAEAAYRPRLEALRFHPVAWAALDDVVAACRDEGIPVALLLMPEADRFRAWYTPQTHAAIDALTTHLRGRGAAACFDTRSWFPDLHCYCDSHHLLTEYGEAFSRRFAAECLAPWLAGLPVGRATGG